MSGQTPKNGSVDQLGEPDTVFSKTWGITGGEYDRVTGPVNGDWEHSVKLLDFGAWAFGTCSSASFFPVIF